MTLSHTTTIVVGVRVWLQLEIPDPDPGVESAEGRKVKKDEQLLYPLHLVLTNSCERSECHSLPVCIRPTSKRWFFENAL
jgi:hypothetical protein